MFGKTCFFSNILIILWRKPPSWFMRGRKVIARRTTPRLPLNIVWAGIMRQTGLLSLLLIRRYMQYSFVVGFFTLVVYGAENKTNCKMQLYLHYTPAGA